MWRHRAASQVCGRVARVLARGRVLPSMLHSTIVSRGAFFLGGVPSATGVASQQPRRAFGVEAVCVAGFAEEGVWLAQLGRSCSFWAKCALDQVDRSGAHLVSGASVCTLVSTLPAAWLCVWVPMLGAAVLSGGVREAEETQCVCRRLQGSQNWQSWPDSHWRLRSDTSAGLRHRMRSALRRFCWRMTSAR